MSYLREPIERVLDKLRTATRRHVILVSSPTPTAENFSRWLECREITYPKDCPSTTTAFLFETKPWDQPLAHPPEVDEALHKLGLSTEFFNIDTQAIPDDFKEKFGGLPLRVRYTSTRVVDSLRYPRSASFCNPVTYHRSWHLEKGLESHTVPNPTNLLLAPPGSYLDVMRLEAEAHYIFPHVEHRLPGSCSECRGSSGDHVHLLLGGPHRNNLVLCATCFPRVAAQWTQLLEKCREDHPLRRRQQRRPRSPKEAGAQAADLRLRPGRRRDGAGPVLPPGHEVRPPAPRGGRVRCASHPRGGRDRDHQRRRGGAGREGSGVPAPSLVAGAEVSKSRRWHAIVKLGRPQGWMLWYDEGSNAFKLGEACSRNPYDKGGMNYRAWRDGWQSALHSWRLRQRRLRALGDYSAWPIPRPGKAK